MARLRRSVQVSAGAEEQRARDEGVPDSVIGYPSDTEWDRPVSEAEAWSSPSVAGALQIIAGGAASVPLRRFNGRGEAIDPGTLLAHPEPDEQRPLPFTIRRTVEALAFSGRAYWRVLLRDYQGRAAAVVNLDPWTVFPRGDYVPGIGLVIRKFQVDDIELPVSDVIMFEGPVKRGWCVAGARAIRTSLALERAAKTYADEPIPLVVLKNRSGVDLPTEKVTGILARWKESRRKHATAYLGATLDLEQVGFDARAVQLVEGRQQSVLEIARLSGVPSGMLASAPSGTSLTYRNVEGEKLQVLQAMLPYLVAIESRLSAEDVTPRGQSVRFDLSGMMRPDTATVARMVQSLVPLDVLDVDEGRAFLGLPSRGRAPNPASLPTPGSGAVAERVDPVGITAGAMPTPIRIRADRPRRADGRFAPTHITVTAGEPIDPGDIDGHELPGMVVPWNVAAMVHGVPEPVVFERGSLTADASVRLVLHHDIRQAVGRPVEWADGEDGLRAVFAMGRSARAADARSDALDGILDGFSVGANVTDGYRADGALHITAARLVEVSLVTLPAFTAARVGAARPTEGATP